MVALRSCSLMETISGLFVRFREIVIGRLRAQSMTEYALILAAIALVVFAAYQVMGNTVSKLVSGEDSTLSSA
jgi:Flp pilus assembly pilin Flp